MRISVILAAVIVAGVSAGSQSATADERGRTRTVEQGPQFSEHPRSQSYRGTGPQVRGYVERKGGYSYNYSDSMIDYRDTSLLSEGYTGRRQTQPFDNDFFFDSGVSRHNSSPYLN
jgi:hypothetical protein